MLIHIQSSENPPQNIAIYFHEIFDPQRTLSADYAQVTDNCILFYWNGNGLRE